jgi:hypothetical protein
MKNIILLSCCALVASCTNRAASVNAIDSLPLKSTVSINVDSLTNYNFFSMQLFEKAGKSYLIGFDAIFQSVNVFDLSTEKLERKIQISTEGENGMLKIDGVYFHNFDSIFLFHRYPTKVYMVDYSGSIKSKWEVDKPLPGPLQSHKYLLEVGFANKQVYFNPHNRSLNLQIYYDIQPVLKSLSLPVIGEYDLDADSVINAYGCRPKDYLDLFVNNEFYGALRMNPRFAVIDSITFIAYPFSHEVEIYNNRSGIKMGEVSCKSKFVDHFNTTSVEYPGAEASERYLTVEPSYDGLIYDKYRDKIYRIVKHSQSYKDDDDKKNLLNEASWSLMILDRNLRTVDEVSFAAKQYDFTNAFVNKDGLVVRHVDKEDGKIEVSVFDVGI